ncbi:Lrp/AsnC family transcriptional regulator [Cellulomonas fengjieae]|uniref:Lrp/AsnC family transcriptional regulator n=1 Tax=Cellulomonas fengjieae TaxID=2819978 RepID=A0ABS3SI41_9CELL|nr:Lrp/AsnC family transcriptional regulator [Cellulomonas fengjieae]MBO3085422.1 Lrp/AsnC family transcriptional regulator [Cellulomonas fengjieae]QVI66028.1 Lrp/AsnC family transcriptional regulator [Cellulomonas fengjieae]
MDELDSVIVSELQRDARLTNRELARRLGIAPSTCLERVRLLRRRGVILGYRAAISPAALNRQVEAFISTRLRPLNRTVIDGFRAAVLDLPEVVAVYVIAGDEDFLIHVAVPDLDHLHAFLVDRLAQRREVVSFRSQIVYQSAHKDVLERLPL